MRAVIRVSVPCAALQRHEVHRRRDAGENPTFTSGPAEIVGARFRDDEHTVKAGLNYRFGWGGPVVAKY